MKHGNIKHEEIDNTVNCLNLSKEDSLRLIERLKRNFINFLPGDIPQEIIIKYSADGKNKSIIDFMYSIKSNPKDMEPALLYPKHSYNINYIVNRIQHIFSNPNFTDKIKELYYLESICNEEMMGKSAIFYYRWYSAVIAFSDFIKGSTSIQQVTNKYHDALSMGLEFAGQHVIKFCTEMLNVSFNEYAESKNTNIITDLLSIPIFRELKKQGHFDIDIYKCMFTTGFSIPELNPEKMILESWEEHSDGYNKTASGIANRLAIDSRTVMDCLIAHGKISKEFIIDSWNRGDEVDSISQDLGLEIKDVQNFLKENASKLKRTEDIYKLDWDYDLDEDW